MQTLSDETWQRLTFGDVQSHGALAVLPIMAELPTGPEYLTLSEALAAGTLVITEVSEGGSVPELAVLNEGDLPVLLLDGEELAGAKQNRVVNTTILLKERSKTVIPVSCVEQGRWHYASREFQDSGNVMAANLRARKGQAVSESLASSGRRASDQGEVWAGVEEMACSFQVASDTGAMRDVYAHVEHDLTALLRAFTPVPGQRGIAAFIGGRITGVEYLSQPRAFAKVFEKLLRSYALDALRLRKPGENSIDPEQARQFLATIAASAVQSYAALGYGREHRIDGTGAHGSALTVDDALIHLSLLATAPNDGGDEAVVPFPRAYWVRPGQLLAGCYPGAPGPREALRKLRGLLDAGIHAVISLMEPEETDHRGRPFTPYEDHLYRLASEREIAVTCLRLPIPDQCVPTRETMRQILDAIDALLENGTPTYIHCWGGKGRTGTVVGCWLARHGLANGDEALRMVQNLRRNDPTANQPSPENRIQCNMVRNWQTGE
ncbi:MAG: ARPP-1 family domain-containing protein [Armatimonadota bacterium]